jgi:hypothetical protein
VGIHKPLPALGALLSAATALTILASSALAVGARIPATTQPASGGWKIRANHSQPGPAINDFDGSFEVKGSNVTDLNGVTQGAVNRGCIAHQHVTMVGGATIRHFLNPSIPADYYYVGKVNGFAKVSLTFQDSGTKTKPAKIDKGEGELRIFFPGGTDTRGGFTEYSNLTYSSSTAGICNLEFSVTVG